jgi:hypothetical protein
MESASLQPHAPGRRDLAYLCAISAVVLAVLLVYAQTFSYTGDEGFHLVAAQLILAGKRPYLDFCFPQTPLEAWWNAAWMRLFGQSWRVIHTVSAVLTAAGVALMADYVFRRFPAGAWRIGAAIAVAVVVGFNTQVVEYGTVAQAYALLLFTAVAAFRLAVAAVERRTPWWAAAAGLAAGIGAASSLLAALIGPVLLAWIFLRNRAASRWTKSAAFLAAFAVPFLPVVWLFAQSPWVVWFNVAGYHLSYRAVYWPDPLPHDLEVLTAWTGDPLALLTGLLAIAGVVFLQKRSHWPAGLRAEFYLCGWLALAISAELAFGHPTFARYFMVMTPFAGVLAAVGLYAIGSRVFDPQRPFWPVLVIGLIAAAVLGRAFYDRLDVYTWPEQAAIAAKVKQVTPPGAPIFVHDVIYFLTRSRPLPGMEFDYSHKLNLRPAQLAALHVMPEAEVKRLASAGRFATAVSCDDDEIKDYGFAGIYAHQAEVSGCSVFWSPKAGSR